MIRLPFGEGAAVVDPADGAVLALEHPARPGAPWLLVEATESWHSREHRWGTGLLITSAGAGRWNAPAELAIEGSRIEARHAVAPGLELRVTRELGETWRERYVLRNATAGPVTVLAPALRNANVNGGRVGPRPLTAPCLKPPVRRETSHSVESAVTPCLKPPLRRETRHGAVSGGPEKTPRPAPSPPHPAPLRFPAPESLTR